MRRAELDPRRTTPLTLGIAILNELYEMNDRARAVEARAVAIAPEVPHVTALSRVVEDVRCDYCGDVMWKGVEPKDWRSASLREVVEAAIARYCTIRGIT